MSFFSSHNSLYLFGGYNCPYTLNDFHKYNVKEKTWLTLLPPENKELPERAR